MTREDNLEQGAGNDPILRGLDDLAGQIGSQTFPGRAWSPARRSAFGHPLLYKLATGALAAAAAILVAIHLWPAPPSPSPTPAPEFTAIPAPPSIIIVEDFDSYSIIDLATTPSVVTFAQKRSVGFPPAMALLTRPNRQNSTRKSYF